MFMIPQLFGGGAERVTAVLANELCKNNEVSIVVYKRGNNDYSIDERIKIYDMESQLTGSGHDVFAKMKALKRIIKNTDPVCVISLAGPGAAVLLAVLMVGMKTKLILSERNDPKNFPKEKFLRVLRRIAYELCDGVVFQTKEAKNFFSKRIKRKSCVIKNPVLCELPNRFEGEREHKIVNWCRLNEQKNLDLLIEAFSDVEKEFPEYTLEIYGEGPERERLADKIKKLGLDKKVFLCGHSDKVHEKVYKAALFVSSSDFEGISNSMLEAMAMGIPCVCTDCPAGGARETIENKVNGILVSVGNRECMADAIRCVLGDKNTAENLSKEGEKLRKEIEAEFIAEQWMKFALELL